MRKITILKSMLLLCALIVGVGTSWAADKWVKTAPADLETGDIVVIVDQTTAMAMSNNGGTSSAPKATAVTLNDDKSEITSEVATTLQWEVTVNNGSYQFNVADKENYLYCTNTNNGVRVGTNSNNVFTVYDNSGVDFLYNTATERYVGVYRSQDWRCYTSINANIKSCVTAFYKKTVDPTKKTVTLSFPENSYTVDINDGFADAPKATADKTITGIKYSSSNTTVATVDEGTGAVTLKKVGTTTIKATFAGDGDYNSAEASYTLTVINSNANDGTEAKPFTVEEAIENTPASGTSDNYYIKGIVSAFYGDDIVSDGTYYRYYISDDGTTNNQLLVYKGKGLNNVAFANASDLLIGDEIVILGGLTTYNSTKEIAANNYIVSRKTKANPNLIVEESVELYVDQQKAVSELYLIEEDYAGAVSFTSSNETVAKVEGGMLKALAVGTAVITVTAAADANYKTASETITVTVKGKDVTPEGTSAGGNFVKVTTTADITDGDYLIVYEAGNKAFNGSLETLDATDDVIDVTISDGTIAATETTKAAIFTINTTDGTLKSASGYYIGVSSNSNGLKQAGDKETYTNAFSIDDDKNAVITAVFDGSTMSLRFNEASNQNRFRYYKNAGQEDIQLYKFVESNSFDIEIGATEWRTIVTAADVTVPEGVTAYVVSANDGTTAELQTVSTIKANTPYLLNGSKGTYTMTVTEEASAPAANLLQISTESTGNGVYVLANGTNGVGFYKWNGGHLGAGRVYLPAAAAGAPNFIGFGTTTGIEVVKSAEKALSGEVYNLAGQKVGAGYKGIVIVNGKKAVMK